MTSVGRLRGAPTTTVVVTSVGTAAILAGHVLLRSTWWRYEWQWSWFQFHFATVLLTPFTAGVACWWGTRWSRARELVGSSPRAVAAVCRLVAAVWLPTVATYLVGLAGVSVAVARTTGSPPPARILLSLPPPLALLGAATALGVAIGYRWASRALAPLVGVVAFVVLMVGYTAGPARFVKVGGATASLLGLAPRPEIQLGQTVLFSGIALLAIAVVARSGPRRGAPTAMRIGLPLGLVLMGTWGLRAAGNQEFDHVAVPMVCEGAGPEICVEAGYLGVVDQLRANLAPTYRSLDAAGLPLPETLVQLPLRTRPDGVTVDPVTILRTRDMGDGYLVGGYVPDDCDLFDNERAGNAFDGISLYLQRTYGEDPVRIRPEERLLLQMAHADLVACRD